MFVSPTGFLLLIIRNRTETREKQRILLMQNEWLHVCLNTVMTQSVKFSFLNRKLHCLGGEGGDDVHGVSSQVFIVLTDFHSAKSV